MATKKKEFLEQGTSVPETTTLEGVPVPAEDMATPDTTPADSEGLNVLLASMDQTDSVPSSDGNTSNLPELTEAAHIIPWSEREECRLLPSNGIALNTLLHWAYDADLLGIDEKCRVYVSKPLLKGAKDSKLQAFFESVDGAVLQPSRHFTPSPALLGERFAGFLEHQPDADALLINARKEAEVCGAPALF